VSRTTTAVTLVAMVAAALSGAAAISPPAAAQALAPARLEVPLGLDLYLPAPETNPLDAGKIALGRMLFFDPRLSVDGTMSCSTCHDPARAFADDKPVAEGVFGRKGTRNVPTLVNRGYGASHFLDGRAASLENQVLQPIENRNELGYNLQLLVATLGNDTTYRAEFQQTFGGLAVAGTLAEALASYVRSILSGNAAVDRYLNGDRRALSSQQLAGMRIFVGRGNCSACHVGANFTDEEFHNTGVAWVAMKPTSDNEPATDFADVGRYAVTGAPRDLGAFKTPTLREIASTAPYMHDGSLASLAEVIDFYDRGGTHNPRFDRRIQPLGLTPAEKEALLSYLDALGGTVQEGTP